MVIFEREKCILCGKCVQDCYPRAIREENGKMSASELCMLCGHCVAICPNGAVSISEYVDKPEEYVKESFHVEPDNMLHTIKFRRSIRKYKRRKVEREKLQLLIEVGMHTATASNRQDLSYIVVQDCRDELRYMVFKGLERFVEREKPTWACEDNLFWGTMKEFYKERELPEERERLFRNAPAIIYVLGDSAIDAGLAAQNMELMASTLGLGFLYNGYLTRISMLLSEVKEFLNMGERKVLMCIMVGYPDVEYRRTAPRKTPEVLWI